MAHSHDTKVNRRPGNRPVVVGGTEGEAVIDRNSGNGRQKTSPLPKSSPDAPAPRTALGTATKWVGGWLFPPMGAVRGADTAKHK